MNGNGDTFWERHPTFTKGVKRGSVILFPFFLLGSALTHALEKDYNKLEKDYNNKANYDNSTPTSVIPMIEPSSEVYELEEQILQEALGEMKKDNSDTTMDITPSSNTASAKMKSPYYVIPDDIAEYQNLNELYKLLQIGLRNTNPDPKFYTHYFDKIFCPNPSVRIYRYNYKKLWPIFKDVLKQWKDKGLISKETYDVSLEYVEYNWDYEFAVDMVEVSGTPYTLVFMIADGTEPCNFKDCETQLTLSQKDTARYSIDFTQDLKTLYASECGSCPEISPRILENGKEVVMLLLPTKEVGPVFKKLKRWGVV